MNIVVLMLMTLFISVNVHADQDREFHFKRNQIKNINVVAPEWEDYTNVDGTGLYWDILRSIYSNQGVKLKHSSVSWNRALKMVTKYQVYNAIVGEYLDSEEPLIFPKYPIDVEYLSVLSKNSEVAFVDMSSLTGKRVGWLKDYDLIDESERDFTLREYRTVQQGLELLNTGKLDYMIEEWDEIASVLSTNNLSLENYQMKEMPEGTDVYVAFADNAISKVLIEIYNEEVEAMVKSGSMQAIYKKWDLGEMPEVLQDAGSN
jgi:ABC-type amino acid transport substrate-binding protein